LIDLPEETGLISDWMPVEDPAFIGDQVRHDWNPLGLVRHSGPASSAR
jgi:hypothetical protein